MCSVKNHILYHLNDNQLILYMNSIWKTSATYNVILNDENQTISDVIMLLLCYAIYTFWLSSFKITINYKYLRNTLMLCYIEKVVGHIMHYTYLL